MFAMTGNMICMWRKQVCIKCQELNTCGEKIACKKILVLSGEIPCMFVGNFLLHGSNLEKRTHGGGEGGVVWKLMLLLKQVPKNMSMFST